MSSQRDTRPGLSDLERTLLLALLHCGGTAHGSPLQTAIEERTGRRLSPGALYTVLARMEEKGLVRSWKGEPTPERGGRRKRIYSLTHAGQVILDQLYEIRTSLYRRIKPSLS